MAESKCGPRPVVARVFLAPVHQQQRAALLEAAGSCWVLPEFHGKTDAKLVTTLKEPTVKWLQVSASQHIC